MSHRPPRVNDVQISSIGPTSLQDAEKTDSVRSCIVGGQANQHANSRFVSIHFRASIAARPYSPWSGPFSLRRIGPHVSGTPRVRGIKESLSKLAPRRGLFQVAQKKIARYCPMDRYQTRLIRTSDSIAPAHLATQFGVLHRRNAKWGVATACYGRSCGVVSSCTLHGRNRRFA